MKRTRQRKVECPGCDREFVITIRNPKPDPNLLHVASKVLNPKLVWALQQSQFRSLAGRVLSALRGPDAHFNESAKDWKAKFTVPLRGYAFNGSDARDVWYRSFMGMDFPRPNEPRLDRDAARRLKREVQDLLDKKDMLLENSYATPPETAVETERVAQWRLDIGHYLEHLKIAFAAVEQIEIYYERTFPNRA